MASGWSHAKVNALATAGLLGIAHHWQWPKAELIALGLGCLVSTVFLSPDIDIKQSISSRSWGILRVLWVPYHRVFRHRKLSHWPLVGTLSRLIYLWVMLEMLAYAVLAIHAYSQSLDPVQAIQASTEEVYGHKQEILYFVEHNRQLLLAFFYGLAITDLFHTLVDHISSFWKRRQRSRRLNSSRQRG